MTKTTFIYALLDPGSDDVRYVGKADNVDKRLKEHVYYCDVDRTHKGCWVLSLQKQGKKPKLVVLEEVPLERWQEAEKRWIAYYREVGARLTNIHPGGGGCAVEGRKRRKNSDSKAAHKKAGRPFLSDTEATTKIEVTLTAVQRDKLDRITNNRSAWVRQAIEAAGEPAKEG